MIKNTEHCVLCEHKKQDFKTGAYCGLNNEKPKFLNKCSSKEFGDVLEKRIVELNTEVALVENTKSKTMLHVYTYLSFSVIVLAGDYFFTIDLWEKGWMSTITLVIGGVGLSLIPFAIMPLNKYRKGIRIAIERKNNLDEVLKLYNYSYDFDIKLAKGPHDILDIDTQVKIHSKNR